jgi:hypothetical protein
MDKFDRYAFDVLQHAVACYNSVDDLGRSQRGRLNTDAIVSDVSTPPGISTPEDVAWAAALQWTTAVLPSSSVTVVFGMLRHSIRRREGAVTLGELADAIVTVLDRGCRPCMRVNLESVRIRRDHGMNGTEVEVTVYYPTVEGTFDRHRLHR